MGRILLTYQKKTEAHVNKALFGVKHDSYWLVSNSGYYWIQALNIWTDVQPSFVPS